MNQKDARFNRRLALLVLSSFTVFGLAVVLRLGIGATSYETTDSAGRPMGFNDPLNAEHYLIMLRNFNPRDFLSYECGYEWVLFAAHIFGATLLLTSGAVCSRATRLFFAIQPLIFPLGILAVFFLPNLVADFLKGRMDREGFIDIPFIWAIAHPVWILSSIVIAFLLRGKGLGLSRVWGRVPMGEPRSSGV